MAAPRITCPVARTLEVRDLERSIEFYRDVLGFAPPPAGAPAGRVHLTYGPAELDLVIAITDQASMLFFETDDVAAMHATIRDRGGEPSDVARVNWIKLRMFQVRDPDGHILMFGRPFDPEALRNMNTGSEKGLPELPVDDVTAAVAFYRDALGFQVNFEQVDLGVLDRGEIRVILTPRGDRPRGSGAMYAYVCDADVLYAEFRSRGVSVASPPITRPWGLREFDIMDLDGNRLRFGQPFE